MNLLESLTHFTLPDAVGVVLLLLAWVCSSWWIENPRLRNLSVTVLMQRYRQDWMHEYVTRSPRIFDATILSSLRQGTTFFASACMLTLGGGLALIGNPDRLTGVASDLALSEAPAVVWEVKILLVLLFVAHAFLKFVWAHRLFGYCAVLMAAVPNDPKHPRAYPRAARAGHLNAYAAKSYNRALRSIYFALGALGWLAGGWALIISACITMTVIWRREFASRSRAALLESADAAEVAPGPGQDRPAQGN